MPLLGGVRGGFVLFQNMHPNKFPTPYQRLSASAGGAGRQAATLNSDTRAYRYRDDMREAPKREKCVLIHTLFKLDIIKGVSK
jgi:hypothetical protein